MPDQKRQSHGPVGEVPRSQQTPGDAHERNAPSEPSFYVQYQPRILVVDDAPLLRKQLLVSLSKAGFVVEEAADGTEALAAVRA